MSADTGESSGSNRGYFNSRLRQQSLSGALSLSLGLSSSFNAGSGSSVDKGVVLGRSFVGSYRPQRLLSSDNEVVNDNSLLHEQTESLANDFDEIFSNEENSAIYGDHEDGGSGSYVSKDDEQDDGEDQGDDEDDDEMTQLLHSNTLSNAMNSTSYDYGLMAQDIESQGKKIPNRTEASKILQEFRDTSFLKIVGYIPSVILGLLLNILDGLSYGMIIFPIGEPVFKKLGAAGLSMFYVSCIVSQLVYSLGGSAFGSGVGSEMIEVTPFFHAMATTILREIGEDKPNSVISTTITTYAVSSMITGLIFLLLGKFKLGQLVGFFPRHILIGCIGGVGYFLIITGIEISSKLGSFEYTIPYLKALFLDVDILTKVMLPVVLTVLLIFLQSYNSHSLILPSFYIIVFAIIHIVIIIVPTWDLQSARDNGYMFSTGSEGKQQEPWYSFYTLYDFKLVHWMIILKQVPSMLALTFFGILHVPINVPALTVSTKQDDVDVDRELIAHGISNLLSGAIGSIQNYLVYTNSLLFIRAGADSRVAGVMLAVATFMILLVGPIVIGFIPVCVVGSLIFVMGYELLKESIWDTIHKVSRFEYITIVVIVFTMGIYDFVGGIVIGIIIASFHFLYENTKIPTITNKFTGEVARSTVIRHPLQKQFLKNVGKQIYVLKLQSYLFFGSIGTIEKQVKLLFDDENYSKNPIYYLILDFKNVLNVDFSAAEGLNRIKNFLFDKKAYLIISIGDETKSDKIITSLTNVGLFDGEQDLISNGIQVFRDLNSSLEWCENEFLTKYKEFKHSTGKAHQPSKQLTATDNYNIGIPSSTALHASNGLTSMPINTPRNQYFLKEAQQMLKKESVLSAKTKKEITDYKEPLALLLFAFQGLSKKDVKFWNELIPFFEKKQISKDEEFKYNNKESFFLLVESGILSINYEISHRNDFNIYETLLPRTVIGRLNDEVLRKDRYSSKIVAKSDSVVWTINDDAIKYIKLNRLKIFNELLLIVVKLNEERFENVTGYSLISS